MSENRTKRNVALAGKASLALLEGYFRIQQALLEAQAEDRDLTDEEMDAVKVARTTAVSRALVS